MDGGRTKERKDKRALAYGNKEKVGLGSRLGLWLGVRVRVRAMVRISLLILFSGRYGNGALFAGALLSPSLKIDLFTFFMRKSVTFLANNSGTV